LSRPINALLARLGGDKLIWDFGVARQLVELARDFDLVHLHNLHGYYLNYRRLLDGLQGKPVVWTWHDMWPITGRCGVTFGCEGWRRGCAPCPHLDYYPATWIDQARHSFAIRTQVLINRPGLSVVTPSRWLANLGVARGFAPEWITVLPNPIDVASFQPSSKVESRRALGLPHDSPVLLFVASDCANPCKGFQDFATVVRSLGACGLAVGSHGDSAGSGLQAVGPVRSPSLLASYYSAADALIVPSLSDNYPNTVIEAQCCGTPVFAYRTGGLPEQLPPFWHGVAEVHDATGLAKLVDDYLRSGGKTDSLSNRIGEYASATWSLAAAAASYRAVFARALGREVANDFHPSTGVEVP
jgi:glycosyltransferase involved in cell wall biosynthesis